MHSKIFTYVTDVAFTCSRSLLRAVGAVMAIPFLVSTLASSVRRVAVSSVSTTIKITNKVDPTLIHSMEQTRKKLKESLHPRSR